MRRFGLITLFVVLATGYACGQKADPASPPAKMSTPPAPVKVYAPGRGVKAPKLLSLNTDLYAGKDCGSYLDDKVKLNFLVDTDGRARNVMFLQPAGSVLDRFAIYIAEADRFSPGTLGGKPVVVAESMEVSIQTCVEPAKIFSGRPFAGRSLRSTPRQKLHKPKNPPEEAVLSAGTASKKRPTRLVTRPDYFGADVSAPVLIYYAEASYRPRPFRPGINGVVLVSLIVDAHGLPLDVRVLRPLNPGLDQSAVVAVNKYRFFPAIKNEEPVPAAINVEVKFLPPGAVPPRPVLENPDFDASQP
jgi:TonB family protein